ncbi:TlpA family protein disulfide reductase [Ammoniphilus resinae]|uniref:Thiol-disulfide isomerase/thioredoxin n=1 Tax=Ammoniphilus resinae TaxID=861532 RepID=A0ABS4GQ68_9BACL|nr:TlpA disulfide reductase family protein [Ammoniphilus resinae]MBP1932432.1 thiol-disulfide isomerase/thioredoxin [Ammoniphilus resinae]
MRLRWLVLLLTVLVLGGCSVAAKDDAEQQQAPAFTLKDLNGEEVSLQQYEGKLVLLSFWNSWCGPCKTEMPILQKLQTEYPDQVAVIGVNLSFQDIMKDVKAFVEDHQIEYKIALDKLGEVADSYQVRELPVLYLISPEGKILKRMVGAGTEEALRSEIEKNIEK